MSSSSPQEVEARNPQEDQPKNTSWVKRRISVPLGFSKFYNFPLWFIFAGALFGFSLARLSYLNIDGGDLPSSFSGGSSPGEWFHYRKGHYRVGITIHLAAVLPLGILCIWQFLPIIRHKFLLFHRINGYICLLLLLISHAGALMIARRAFGGSLETQTGVGLLVIMTTLSASLAYYNIKRLQIDQHRAWMLRTFFYMGTIITLRIIMIITAKIIASINGYYQIQTCEQVSFVRDSPSIVAELYPTCINASVNTPIIVPAAWEGAENIGAALGLSFGAALWLALFLHAVGVEIYLALTPKEGERLRIVSWERQVEAGFEYPGSAGLVVERWGDAVAWCPPGRSNEMKQ